MRCPPSSTTHQTPASEISPASSASYNARRAQILRRSCEPLLPSPPHIAPLSGSAHRPSASTHHQQHPRPRCASQTRHRPAISTPTPQSVRRSTNQAALRRLSAPPVSVAAALHRPRLRSARHRMRRCPQRGVIFRLATVHAPSAPAARPRPPWSRALNHSVTQARAQHQHRLENRSSGHATGTRGNAARHVCDATRGERSMRKPPSSMRTLEPCTPPAASRSALRRRADSARVETVAVSSAGWPLSRPCARAAHAPGTTAPRAAAPLDRGAHTAPHQPPTRHAERAQHPPPAHAAAAHAALRASPMRSMYVRLRSHAEPSASETALAFATLIRSSCPSSLQRQARPGLHERPAKPHTHPRVLQTTACLEIQAQPPCRLCAAPEERALLM